MSLSLAGAVAGERPARPRPLKFLVSTTRLSGGIRDSLGHAAYSYVFVLEALAPVLERLGRWGLVEHPESSLLYAAAEAEAEGDRPIHLALLAPQDAYLAPGLPNVIFPFWEFPHIPDRDLGGDTHQNWSRICPRADLVLTACEFTADAFRRAGLSCPIAVVPVPIPPRCFEVPSWAPEHTWTISCRHLVWGGREVVRQATYGPDSTATSDPVSAGQVEPDKPPLSWTKRAGRHLRKIDRNLGAWMSPSLVMGWQRAKRWLRRLPPRAAGRGSGQDGGTGGARFALRGLGFVGLRRLYRRHIRPWFSDEALERVAAAKLKSLGWLGLSPSDVHDPLLPSSPLTLGGLVYTSIFNLGDRRKNETDLLTAFLLAFRDRPDVTLVLKLATNPACEFHELNLLRRIYSGLGLTHQCRVVVITEFLNEEEMNALTRATTYYVNTSRAEGACLPLQHALAGGRPALAPDHTALADYMDSSVGFVLRTHPEPTYWPHDPDRRTATYWNRLVWSDLHDLLRVSADVIANDPGRYRAMSEAARRRMAATASQPVAAEALRRALELLSEPGHEALTFTRAS